ncbi:MAG TPA: hypothetical protein DDW50_20800 [Firmicutes bacterium]|nr:hypothetical protein [Bacillota bacterium]
MSEAQWNLEAMSRQSSVLRIYCLGVFRVVRPGEQQAIGIVSKHKIWLLFKYLMGHKGSAIQTEKVMELLWPDSLLNDTATLRTTISRLKSLLEPHRIGYQRSSYIIYSKDSCAFNLHAPYWLDVDEFEGLCTSAHQLGNSNRSKATELYLEALSLYEGDYLAEDPDLEWALVPREYYRRLFIDATAEVTRWLLETKEWDKAGSFLKEALKIDPYAEKLQILLMKSFLGMGKLKAAAELYSYYSSFLYKELGVKPSQEWKSLYKQLRDPNTDSPGKRIMEGKMEMLAKESGPMVCEVDFFWNFLLFERRRLARTGGESSLIVLGLAQNAVGNSSQNGVVITEELESIVYQRLRKSDIFCRLDQRHLAILLPLTAAVGSKVLALQISELLKKKLQDNTLNLEVVIKPVTPL